MKRRPVRTAVLAVVTVLVWFLAVKVNFHTEEPPARAGAPRHLPHIDVGPGTVPVTSDDPAYTFIVPTGFAVHPATGDLVPVSWLPTGARITHDAVAVAVDTDRLDDTELAASTEANPDGPLTGVVETYAINDFRVVVTDAAHTYTAYHGRTVVTFTSEPPLTTLAVFDPEVFPAAMRMVLSSLEFG